MDSDRTTGLQDSLPGCSIIAEGTASHGDPPRSPAKHFTPLTKDTSVQEGQGAAHPVTPVVSTSGESITVANDVFADLAEDDEELGDEQSLDEFCFEEDDALSWLSIFSHAGLEWILNQTGNRNFVAIAKKALTYNTLSSMHRLATDVSPEVTTVTAWEYVDGESNLHWHVIP